MLFANTLRVGRYAGHMPPFPPHALVNTLSVVTGIYAWSDDPVGEGDSESETAVSKVPQHFARRRLVITSLITTSPLCSFFPRHHIEFSVLGAAAAVCPHATRPPPFLLRREARRDARCATFHPSRCLGVSYPSHQHETTLTG